MHASGALHTQERYSECVYIEQSQVVRSEGQVEF